MPDDASDLSKIANLLGLMVTKGMPRATTVVTLQSCGFSTRDISQLTGSAENSVRAMLSAAKKKVAAKDSDG